MRANIAGLLMILAGCVPELGQRCAADDDCAAAERCDPPGWCVPFRGADAGEAIVDAGPDAADQDADAAPPDAGRPDADVPDVSVADAAPDAFVGCGDWVEGGAGCVPPELACESGEAALARGCLALRPECGEGWHATPGGCALDEALGCSEGRRTAGPEGCIPERACPPSWGGEPCRRRVQLCQPSQVSAPDGGCRPLRPACTPFNEDARLVGGPVVFVRPGPPVPDPAADGTSGAPYRGIGTALAAAPDAIALILQPGMYAERVDLQARSIYLRGTCEAAATVVAGLDAARDVQLAHLTFTASSFDEPAIRVAGATLTLSDVQITGGTIGLLADDARIDADDLRIEGASQGLLRGVDAQLVLRRTVLRGVADVPALDATDSALEITDLTVSGAGVRLRGAGGVVTDALITGAQGAAVDESGTAGGLTIRRLMVQGDGQDPALRFGAASQVTLDDVVVDGQPGLRVEGGDVRVRGAVFESPRGPLARVDGSGYVLVTQAIFAGTTPLVEVGGVGPGHLGLTDTRLTPTGAGPAAMVAAQSSLGLRNVRVDGVTGVGLLVTGPAPADIPSLEAHGLWLEGAAGAQVGVDLGPDSRALLDQLIVSGVGDAALRVDGAEVTLLDAMLALAPAGGPAAAALDHRGGTLTGSRARLEGTVALQVAGGVVTLEQAAALGSRRGVSVLGGEARLTGARIEGETGAFAQLGRLRLDNTVVNGADAPPALVGVGVGEGGEVTLAGVGLGGQEGQRAGLLVAGGGRLHVADVRVATQAGFGVVVDGGALDGDHLHSAAPGASMLLLPGTDVALRYVLTAGLQGVVYRGEAPRLAPFVHQGTPAGASLACDADCPAPPALP